MKSAIAITGDKGNIYATAAEAQTLATHLYGAAQATDYDEQRGQYHIQTTDDSDTTCDACESRYAKVLLIQYKPTAFRNYCLSCAEETAGEFDAFAAQNADEGLGDALTDIDD